jgi:hypothetical protein
VSVGNLALGANDAFAHRGLGDQERTCDLAGRQATERAERQRDPGRHVQRRMAAGEDQPQPVIADKARFGHREFLRPVQTLHRGQPFGAIRDRLVAASSVDCAPPGGHRDPRCWIVRDAIAPPGRQRGLERVLNGVLGDLEVADVPDQSRQDGGPLVPETFTAAAAARSTMVDPGPPSGRSCRGNGTDAHDRSDFN